MKSTSFALRIFALSLLGLGAMAQAATVTGTVTDKTTGKPSAGDLVELVDVQAGMKTAAHATSDGGGHYSLTEPGSGPYLIRVTHQGAGYFIAAPQDSGPGNISVYDVAAKVDGVSVEDDVVEVESENGQLDVVEQYVVHNTSSPRMTQFSNNTFEFVLPAAAVLDGAEATRPSGLPTNAIPRPVGLKGHYSFNVPIQPDEGDNQTVFVVRYHLTYSGKYTFSAKVLSAVSSYVVQLPKAMTFTAGSGENFQPVHPPQQSPSVQFFLLKDALPGKALEFTVAGNGSMPREDQGAQGGPQSGMGGQDSGGGAPDTSGGAPGSQPGGGIGNPINTPDPLSKYKWWILGGMGLLLVVAAAFLLRKPATEKITSLFQRYKDAYSVANGIILLGTIVKFASLALAAIFIIAAFSESHADGQLVTWAAVASGLIFGLLGFAVGVLISAQGQIMLAMIDTAVNTSSLVTTSEKAKMIGILESDGAALTVGDSGMLNELKEELFSLESEKISGAITPKEYAEQKAALETVLKRALKRTGTRE